MKILIVGNQVFPASEIEKQIKDPFYHANAYETPWDSLRTHTKEKYLKQCSGIKHTSATTDRIHHADMMISDAFHQKLFSGSYSQKEYTCRKIFLPIINNYNLLDRYQIQFPIEERTPFLCEHLCETYPPQYSNITLFWI